MKSVVVVGAQWVTRQQQGRDYLAGSFDYICAWPAGTMPGTHVINRKEKHVLQLYPCGILRPKQQAVIGMGVVVDPGALVNEIEPGEIRSRCKRSFAHQQSCSSDFSLSPRELDRAAKARRGANKIGTTSRGIGPAYEDKMARRGLRMSICLEPALFREKRRVLSPKKTVGERRDGADVDFSHEVEETLRLEKNPRLHLRFRRTGERALEEAELGAV